MDEGLTEGLSLQGSIEGSVDFSECVARFHMWWLPEMFQKSSANTGRSV
jgi:hypothetical protein